MTLTEFLAWEQRRDLRYEFDGQRPLAMTGVTVIHDLLTFNLRKALTARLQVMPFLPIGPTMKIIVDGRVRYPDGLVTLGPVPPATTVIDAPIAIFEITSPETDATDHVLKLREYGATRSIQRYVILRQDGPGAVNFARRDRHWIATTAIAGEILDLPELGIGIPMTELYTQGT